VTDIALTSPAATAHDRADPDGGGRTHNVTAHPQRATGATSIGRNEHRAQRASGAIMALQATGEIRADVHRIEPGR
jgi:hypothetical protein